MKPTALSPEQFEQLFKPITYGRFNWRYFRHHDLRVELVIVKTRKQLGKLVLPHVRDSGDLSREASQTSDAARNITVAESAATIHAMGGDSRARILRLAASFAEEKRGVVLALPAYRYPKGRVLLMDGVHRLTGLYLSGAQHWSVAVYVVHGPRRAALAWDMEFSEARGGR